MEMCSLGSPAAVISAVMELEFSNPVISYTQLRLYRANPTESLRDTAVSQKTVSNPRDGLCTFLKCSLKDFHEWRVSSRHAGQLKTEDNRILCLVAIWFKMFWMSVMNSRSWQKLQIVLPQNGVQCTELDNTQSIESFLALISLLFICLERGGCLDQLFRESASDPSERKFLKKREEAPVSKVARMSASIVWSSDRSIREKGGMNRRNLSLVRRLRGCLMLRTGVTKP